MGIKMGAAERKAMMEDLALISLTILFNKWGELSQNSD